MVVLSGNSSPVASGQSRVTETTMKADRFDRNLNALRRRSPFRPFMVELTSGSLLWVEHPEALVARGGEGVYIAKDGEVVFFDHDTVARVVRPTKKKGADNGEK